jgi:hypothetical protein
MYTSVKELRFEMGVDEQIARFFVDRKVPENNFFWKDRLLYVSGGNGFTFIPVYYDLLFRLGIPKEVLLAEEHIQFMERVMHFATLLEFKQVSYEDHLDSIIHLLQGRIRQPEFYSELLVYLRQPVLRPIGRLGEPVPSLNRGDVFLFILCDLPMTGVQLDAAIRYWYGLLPTYLLMDDIYDYQFDKQDMEESSILELGDGKVAFEKAISMLEHNQSVLQEGNPVLSSYFAGKMADLQDIIP